MTCRRWQRAGGKHANNWEDSGIMHQRLYKVLVVCALFLAAPLAGAQEKKATADKPSTVVARVNGYEITAKEVELAGEDVAAQLKDVPPKMRYPLLVQYLIERHLLAQQALKEGLANSEEYKRRLRFYQYKALRDAYFFKKIKPRVTPEKVKEVYERETKKVKPVVRVRARHILVSTKEEAEKILKELKKGAKFEDLARKYSKDGSKEFGGDLGYFTYDEMVPEFSKVAFSLKVGEVSKPVKTEYGWHIIKVEDRKKIGPRPLKEVAPGIEALLLRQEVQKEVAALGKKGKIELLDPELKKLQEETQKKLEELKKKAEAAKKAKGKK